MEKLQRKIDKLKAQNDNLKNLVTHNNLNVGDEDYVKIKQNKDYEYLVLSGGGIKGIAYVGAIQELDKMGVLYDADGNFKIKGIAGSSAGTIIAVLLAIGYKPDEINNIMNEMDFASIVDDKIGYLRDGYNFITKYGICEGNTIMKMMGKLIKAKTGNADYTLIDLYKEKKIKLIITATNLNKRKTIYMYHDHPETQYANISLRTCIRISTSVPFLFEPYELNGCLYCDGGVLDNFPIHCFDDPDNPGSLEEKYCDNTPNFKVLGLRLSSNTHEKNKINKIGNLYDYAYSFIDSYSTENDRKVYIKSNYIRTVFILTKKYPLSKFDLTTDEKNDLINCGSKYVKEYFEN